MFNLFGGKPQVKIEATDTNGNKTTFYRNILPAGESDLDSAEKELKATGENYSSIKITYPR